MAGLSAAGYKLWPRSFEEPATSESAGEQPPSRTARNCGLESPPRREERLARFALMGVAFLLQRGELVLIQDAFRLLEELGPAFFGAAGFHALLLPGRQLGLLLGRQVQVGERSALRCGLICGR